LVVAATLAACAVGPDYKGPPPVAPTSIAAPTFVRASGAATAAGTPPERWWESMDDKLLGGLIADAFKASPSLKSMIAQLRSARAHSFPRAVARLPIRASAFRPDR
jgi:outer membrane protein TolC